MKYRQGFKRRRGQCVLALLLLSRLTEHLHTAVGKEWSSTASLQQHSEVAALCCTAAAFHPLSASRQTTAFLTITTYNLLLIFIPDCFPNLLWLGPVTELSSFLLWNNLLYSYQFSNQKAYLNKARGKAEAVLLYSHGH